MLALWLAVLVIGAAVYHRLPGHAQVWWLLLLSYGLYAWLAWQFLPVLVLLTLATHAVAGRIASTSPQGSDRRRRRLWLWAGVAVNLLALASLRYAYGSSAPFEAPFAVLGLSFYSLQALAYLFDTYSGALRAPGSLAELALYLGYFPKILAGPIERPQAFLRQLSRPRIVDDARLARAGTLIAAGLTRKLVFADPLAARLPSTVFTEPAAFGSLTLAATTVGYAFVLYNDFAGYSSIARGVSCLFGIELSVNFARPFAAHTFTDLWNRWHISFSHWLRDYIYLPSSRYLLRRNLSRMNVANLVLPPLATMLACGLWHGASAHMLLWGGLHGFYLVLERAGRLLWPVSPGTELPAWRRIFGIAVVFSVSCLTFVALRLPIDRALEFWRQLALGPAGELPDGRLFLYMAPSIWLDWMQSRHGEDTLFVPWPRLARAAALATAALLWLVMAGAAPPTPFVYQGF